MSLEIIKAENFRLDMRYAAEWYAEHGGETIARRYLDAIDTTLERLAIFPRLGVSCRHRHPLLSGLRWFPLEGRFAVHLIFYRIFERHLDAFRTVHGMRELPQRLLESPGAGD